MKKYIHPYLSRVYIRNVSGGVFFLFKGLKSKKEAFSSNILVDLKSVFGKKKK